MIRKKLAEKKKKEERNKQFSDIFSKIDSDDIDVLNQSLDLTNEILRNEKERGESAGKRIKLFFAVGGIISGLFSIFGKYLTISSGNFTLLIYLMYVAIIILIIKMAYYFMNSMRIQNNKIIGPNAIYRIQKEKRNNALRLEITRKILDYKDQTVPNNKKLYYLEQMQNNLILIIIFFILLGALSILNIDNIIKMPQNYLIVIGSVFIVISCIFDYVYLKIFRKFWRFE